MRKTEFAFWTFLLMTGLAGATTLLNVSRTIFGHLGVLLNTYRQLDLLNDESRQPVAPTTSRSRTTRC